MICIKLQGGLGNQLFQYAAARALADFHQTTVAFDLSFFESENTNEYTVRPYALAIFSVAAKRIGLWDQIAFGLIQFRGRKWLLKVMFQYQSWAVYKEKTLLYNAGIRNETSRNMYLTGYFQSEKYFASIAYSLREELRFKSKIDNEVSRKIIASNSVSIHIRRGDYVTDQGISYYHGLCSVKYYHEAVYYMTSRKSDLHIFVFSDDITWAKEHLKLHVPTYFMNNHGGGDGATDFQLMSLCKFNIIANSSFSWWAAWLNSNPDKIVIAPKRWFADDNAESESKTIVPETWIRL